MGAICGLIWVLAMALQQPDPGKHKERVQRINVEEPSRVEAGQAGPGGSGVTVRKPAQQPRLLPLRKDFDRELVKAAENM